MFKCIDWKLLRPFLGGTLCETCETYYRASKHQGGLTPGNAERQRPSVCLHRKRWTKCALPLRTHNSYSNRWRTQNKGGKIAHKFKFSQSDKPDFFFFLQLFPFIFTCFSLFGLQRTKPEPAPEAPHLVLNKCSQHVKFCYMFMPVSKSNKR